MFTKNRIADYLRALANEIDDNSIKLNDVYIDNTHKEKEIVINYEELFEKDNTN